MFELLPNDANSDIVHCFARVYIIHLIRGYLMSNWTGHMMSLMYLSLLEDFEITRL